MLILVEKPSSAKNLHPILSAQFPGETLDYLLVNPFGWPFVFDYPSNLAWPDYPFCRPAQYKLNPSMQWRVSFESGQPVRTLVDYTTLTPQRVLALPDSSRSSVSAAHRLVEHLHTLGKVSVLEGYCPLVCIDAPSVQRTLEAPMSASSVASACAEAALKANFEYSFLVNASGLLSRSYHAAGGQIANPVFSKFTVLTLYVLRAAGAMSEGLFIHSKMSRWHGTGRYAPLTANIGSVSSRAELLGTLVALGLAETKPKHLAITSLGHAFLDRLHPDCEDLDLPFRIDEWMTEPASGELKAQRYIRTWFGKQKRFNAS